MDLSVDTVTQTTATFNGNVELTEGGLIEIGVLYSIGNNLTVGASGVNKQVLTPDSSGNVSFKAEELQYDTPYNYCYYVCQNEKYTYGSVKSFTTSSVNMSLSVNSVTQTTATFSGNVELTEDGIIEVGVLYSTGSNLTNGASGVNKQVLTPDSSGNVSFKAEELQYDTPYNYCYYVCQNGKYTYGTSHTFTTQSVTVNLSVDSITQTTATFSGIVELTEDGIIEVGVLYSTGNNLINGASGVTKQVLTPDTSGNFSFKADGLLYDTAYNYCYYVCQNGSYKYGSVQNFMTSLITATLSARVVTQTTATFSGNVNIAETSEIEFGILYSTSDRLIAMTSGVNRLILTSLDNGEFLCKAEGLQFSTKYYYCYYACQDGKYTYGSVSEFTTSSVTMNLSAESIAQTTAVFMGNVKLTEEELIEVGVLYSMGDNLTVDASGVTKKALTPDSSGNVSFKAEGLQFATPYNYCYYICQNGEYVYGEKMSFATLDIVAQDLSVNGTANCYIISESGVYKIKAVKGNSNESIGEVTSSEILWESFGTDITPNVGDLITWTSCSITGYIGFEVPLDFNEGNAVIAAKDANGTILWSWHIWLTDQPQEHIYNNDAGTMMDRNLGATSAIKGDVGALGLLYQWGRKDPFLGSSSISESIIAKSTITWPPVANTFLDKLTIDYAIANPTTFIKGSGLGGDDWFYTGDSSTDNTRWQSTKTIYDPCPAGWRVPDGGESGVWEKAGLDDTTYDSSNKGISFRIRSPSTTWYPAPGWRGSAGGFGLTGKNGGYWSVAPDMVKYAYRLYLNNDGNVYPSDDCFLACGLSVRCLRESK